jgi:hypothetical protein
MGHRPDRDLYTPGGVSLMNLIGTDLRRWADPVWWLVLARLCGVPQITRNQHSPDRNRK